MTKRFAASVGVALFWGVVLVIAPLSVAGGAQTATPKKGTPAGAPAPKKFVPKRLPWGDPDLSGNYTTKDEANTPFERPDEFAGKRIDDIKADELATITAARQQTALENAPFITGSRADGIAIGVPIHWLDHLDSQNSRPWFVTDPPDGKVPPLSEEGKRRTDGVAAYRATRGTADSYTDRLWRDRCIAWSIGVGRSIPGLYGMSQQILQTKDYVAIRYEMIHETRIIPIEGRGAARAHFTPRQRSYYGDATARWEGETLVVDTTNYNGNLPFRGPLGARDDVGSSEKLHTIERFTRVGPNRLEFTATIDDPATWVRPWSYSIPWTEDDSQPIFEYACHEGNYGIRNILAGARSDEKRGIVPSDGPATPSDGKYQAE